MDGCARTGRAQDNERGERVPEVVRGGRAVDKYHGQPIHLPPLTQKQKSIPTIPGVSLVIFIFIGLLLLNAAIFGGG